MQPFLNLRGICKFLSKFPSDSHIIGIDSTQQFAADIEEPMLLNEDNQDTLFKFLNLIVADVYETEKTLETICGFFNASSGCFWEAENQSDGQIFSVTAKFNRPDLDEIIQKAEEEFERENPYIITFNTRSGNTISSRIFTAQRPVYGVIGEDPFNEEWLTKEHTKGLRDLQIKYVALIPFFSTNGEPLGSISLYSKEEMEFQDDVFLKYFGSFFSRLWESSHVKSEELTTEMSLMRHEIGGDLLVLQGGIEKLRKYFDAINRFSSNTVLDTAFEDIEKKVSSIESTLNNTKIIDRSIITLRSKRFTSLSETINENIQPLLKLTSKDVISLDQIFYPSKYLEIMVHPTDLGHVIRNIAENAIKYSAKGSSIRVTIKQTESSLFIRFSNLASFIDQETKDSVWDKRFRGNLDRNENIDGSGLGLYYVSKVCEAYDIKRTFSQDETPANGSSFWTHVQLDFAKKLVRPWN